MEGHGGDRRPNFFANTLHKARTMHGNADVHSEACGAEDVVRDEKETFGRRAEGRVRAYSDVLNEEQLRVVRCPVDTPLMVSAGPGSGKTLTLCYRIGMLAI